MEYVRMFALMALNVWQMWTPWSSQVAVDLALWSAVGECSGSQSGTDDAGECMALLERGRMSLFVDSIDVFPGLARVMEVGTE